MWVFSQFSVPIVPLTKCSYHFWGLHTQIVLDTHTIFAEKPPFVHVKGTTKKADAFGLFVYPNLSRASEPSVFVCDCACEKACKATVNWVPAVGPQGGGQTKLQIGCGHWLRASGTSNIWKRRTVAVHPQPSWGWAPHIHNYKAQNGWGPLFPDCAVNQFKSWS